jgi:hypothetical protein
MAVAEAVARSFFKSTSVRQKTTEKRRRTAA